MAGIYRNQTEGIISLSSDGTTRITIADKNLGATQVYNDGDTLSEANSGKYYQRGNNYGFPFTGTVTTSSTQVNAGTYGPGNYYNSSTFITNSTSPYTWDSSNNDNLWGGTTGTDAAMQGPCDSGYHIASKDERTSIYSILVTDFGLAANASTLKTYLKMPLAGRRAGSSSSKADVGSRGNLWSSTGATTMAFLTYFNSNDFSTGVDVKTSGYSIRPFKNEAVNPDRTWTKLYGDDIPEPVPTINRFIKNGNYFYFKDAPIHISGLALDKSSIALTTVGQTEQLTATITPADAVEKTVTWSSSDTSIATVDNTGLVTCVTPGECTITATCGGYSATCSVIQRKDVYADFLLVGGGGGGGGGYCCSYDYTYYGGGGGGAGGYIECCNYEINSGTYQIVIGAGGAGGIKNMTTTPGCNGGDSCFDGLIAYGGGFGSANISTKGGDGGSGGGGGYYYTSTGSYYLCYGCGISGQGCNGGFGYLAQCGRNYWGSGGGGGGGYRNGGNAAYVCGGCGGNGIQSDISGSNVWYAGGGGGGGHGANQGGCGGCGGGNSGENYSNGCNAGCCGGGGGGGGFGADGGCGAGGVFILRYPTACGHNITGGDCIYTCGDYTIHCFTSSGTLTVN